MFDTVEYEYAVLLAFPGFSEERENAEAIIESALEWLNANKLEPGFRFAPPVGAHLEKVQDADEARDRIAEGGVALVMMHDLPDDERDGLLRYCAEREIGACITVDAPPPTGRPEGPLKVSFRSRPADTPPAHTLAGETLTAPLAEDEATQARIGQAIAVLALGVMQHHWRQPGTRKAQPWLGRE